MKSPYSLDKIIGLDYFITDSPGIGGKLRKYTEDFCVEETYEDSGGKEGEYTHFILEKRNWETLKAIKAISRHLGVSYKRFGYAGTKDKRAVTRQRVAVWRVEQERLENVRINGIKLSRFRKSEKRISLGDSTGNKFRIVIRNVEGDEEAVSKNVSDTDMQLKERGMPNYFGYQRFGVIRPNTQIVGKAIVKGNLEEAVMAYIGMPFEYEMEDAREARNFVQETRDFRGALKIFPMRLGYERAMLDSLAKNPNDYAGALRRLPKKLRWMLVHGYQSFLFNRVLSRMLEEKMDTRGKKIPLFGYKSMFSTGRQGEIEREIVEEEGISFEDFKLKATPEIASEGALRDANIEVQYKIDVLRNHAEEITCNVEFGLPRGSYATVLLREFMKAEPLNY
ncbi:MAG: tRNA pseudouridine(13) synthase TruD [Candidatus Hydrothermarchaeaceae archaeon]